MLMRYFVAFGLLLSSAFAWGQAIRVAVSPMVNAAPCKFAGPDRQGTTDIISRVAMDWLGKALDATDYINVREGVVLAALEDNKIDFGKSGHRNAEKLQAFGKASEADYAIFFLLEWSDQKNPEVRAVASNPNAAKSDNKVRVRVWLHNVTDNKLVIDGSKRAFEANARGPYFGTTNERDLLGDPTAKGIVIANEHRKRAEWLGRAVVLALKDSIQVQMGLKEPPR